MHETTWFVIITRNRLMDQQTQSNELVSHCIKVSLSSLPVCKIVEIEMIPLRTFSSMACVARVTANMHNPTVYFESRTVSTDIRKFPKARGVDISASW